MTPIERQITDLREACGDALARQLSSGATLVTVPTVRLPHGWSKERTSIRFVIPVGYPFATPDCFWADGDLRLPGIGVPQATNVQAIPDANEEGLWFSWHVQSWNPNRDSLLTYFKVIQKRLAEPR
jgi:hypothetical protein